MKIMIRLFNVSLGKKRGDMRDEYLIERQQEENRKKLASLIKDGYKAKMIEISKNGLYQKEEAGLEIELKHYAGQWQFLPKEVTDGKKPEEIDGLEFYIISNEHPATTWDSTVYCAPDGTDLGEPYDYGKNFASYLSENRVVQIDVSSDRSVRITGHTIEMDMKTELLKVSSSLLWSGNKAQLEWNKEKYKTFKSAVERAEDNLKAKLLPAKKEETEEDFTQNKIQIKKATG